MKRKRFVRLSFSLAFAVSLVVLLSGFACNKAKTAAVMVNKYATALTSLQDAEIKWRTEGHIDDGTHGMFQQALKTAFHTGRDLDLAIATANTGGDPSQYIQAAQDGFGQITIIAIKDKQALDDLHTLAMAAGDILTNAISIIKAIQHPQASIPQPHLPLALWLFFPLLGLAATSEGLGKAVSVLQAILELEPYAIDLVIKLAQSLKGKTVDDVVAMNEQLFQAGEAKADAELGKLGKG